jgi:hypothetical protein
LESKLDWEEKNSTNQKQNKHNKTNKRKSREKNKDKEIQFTSNEEINKSAEQSTIPSNNHTKQFEEN